MISKYMITVLFIKLSAVVIKLPCCLQIISDKEFIKGPGPKILNECRPGGRIIGTKIKISLSMSNYYF